MSKISAKDAHALLAEGWAYVDVRSEDEYAAGHPQGAFNVPLLHIGPSGRSANPDFVAAVEALFAKDSKVILGCAAGARSAQALQVLSDAGFTQLRDQRAGWGGQRDGRGQVVEPGWASSGLPDEKGQPEGRSWKDVQKRLQG